MRKILIFYTIILVLLVNKTAAAAVQDTIIQSVIQQREFFVQLDEYSDCLLADVEVLDRGESIGIILLTTEGFEQHIIFNIKTILPIYAKARILSKSDREFLFDTSIRMTEVKRLATAAKLRAAELKRGWALYEGKPGNIVPQNSVSKAPKKASTTSAVETKTVQKAVAEETTKEITPTPEKTESMDYLSKLRKEVELKPEIADMSTQDILERFKADVGLA